MGSSLVPYRQTSAKHEIVSDPIRTAVGSVEEPPFPLSAWLGAIMPQRESSRTQIRFRQQRPRCVLACPISDPPCHSDPSAAVSARLHFITRIIKTVVRRRQPCCICLMQTSPCVVPQAVLNGMLPMRFVSSSVSSSDCPQSLVMWWDRNRVLYQRGC